MVTRGGPGSTDSQQLNEVWEQDNKLVVGIDIGTTQSGVAVAYLEKGERQKIHRITGWPGQGAPDRSSKIPTVIWYNLITKKPELFGAEALSRDGRVTGEDNGWFLAKYFKLHLQPENLREADMKLEQLPPGIPLNQIYSDFLGYLLEHTKTFVQERIPLGKQVWEKYKPTLEVVIAHPNGWNTPEQSFLRDAAIASGFVGSGTQVRFVTEAEASVHYCIHHSNLGSKLKVGTKLVVCDAGGSTVDTTLYSVISTTPILQLGEARISTSVQAGGLLVDIKFEEFFREALKNLELPATQLDDFAMAGIADFEIYAKRNFGTSDKHLTGSETLSVEVAKTGNYNTTSTSYKIHRGCMKVPCSIIKECFDASANLILSSVNDQLKNESVQHILLVGGFGDSPYLHTRFEQQFESDSCGVVLANSYTSKAVADGSVIWSTLCSVVSRTPRRSFGMICAIPFLPWLQIPGGEGRKAYLGPKGIPMAPGAWSQIVKKGIPVDAENVFRDKFHRSIMEDNPSSVTLEVELFGYSGDDEPRWARDPEGNMYPNFQKVGTITAQLLDLEGALKKEKGLFDIEYWDLAAEVCICFGTTELQAHLEWEQNGVKRKGPATIIPGRPIDL